jgi:nucleoside-diphosphate-sugar epimerase
MALARLGADVQRSGRRPPAPAGWAQCDVADLAQVRETIGRARPDFIFHLASTVTGSRSMSVVLPTLHDNLIGTVHVLLAAAECPGAKVVCLGSLQEPDEELRGVPPSPYAAAKLAAGAYARMFGALYGVPVTIARPFMAFGAGQADLTKLVPYVVSQLLRGEPANLSSGAQAFDWVYVDDVVEALLAVAASDAANGMTVDVGCGLLTSVRDVAEGIARRLDAVHLLQFDAVPDRRLEPTRKADVERTHALVGFRARVPLETGLDRTVRWHQDRLAAAK